MGLCEACDQPLVVDADAELESARDDPGQVPDDLKVACGCHFHWQCIMDEASAICNSLKCPSCNSCIASNSEGSSAASIAKILTEYVNEGGLQHDLDIMPNLTEEVYVQENPQVIPARALHVMCAEGDVWGILELLQDVATQQADVRSIVCYQDPLSDMQSTLHVAIHNEQDEVAWLLLWLMSPLPATSFPESLRQLAESAGLGRFSTEPRDDLRSLQDSHGQTARQLAQGQSDHWSLLLENGL